MGACVPLQPENLSQEGVILILGAPDTLTLLGLGHWEPGLTQSVSPWGGQVRAFGRIEIPG